jgi:hypothetical protein
MRRECGEYRQAAGVGAEGLTGPHPSLMPVKGISLFRLQIKLRYLFFSLATSRAIQEISIFGSGISVIISQHANRVWIIGFGSLNWNLPEGQPNPIDLTFDGLGTIQILEACGVDLYLDQQSIDTTTPAGKLMFQVTGAFAEFERSMIRQRVNAGLKRAVEAGKTLGRPRVSAAIEKRVQAQLRTGKGILKVARELGVGTGTVQRIKEEMTGPFADAAA